MSSGRASNFIPRPEERSAGRGYTYAPNSDVHRNYRSVPARMFPPPTPSLASPYASRGARDPWQALEVGPLGLARLNTWEWEAWEPSPIPFLLISSGIAGEITPAGVLGQRNLQGSTSIQEENSRLTQEEQTRALKKLKKEIYNPIPKNISSRLCLYYRDRALQVANERAKEKEEDGKRCAVCLDDFEPKELVMLTPCGHMFHEDCIVPWVRSHGRCPVCRFGLCELR